MPVPFRGSISVDIRDSEPDWTPVEPVKAPDGAPNLIYIVLDDVGFSASPAVEGSNGSHRSTEATQQKPPQVL